MTKIYLAAPWAFKEEAKKVRDQFTAAGIDVTSRWLDLHGQSGDDWNPDILEREAIDDIEDLCASDGIVVLHYKISEGKSFEQGFFLGISRELKKIHKMIVVLPPDFGRSHNVFHYMREVYDVVPTVEDAIAKVQTWNATEFVEQGA